MSIDFGKTLIVYYSHSGNTRFVAEKLKNLINADICEIKIKGNHSIFELAVKTIFRKYLKLKLLQFDTNFPDFSQYDTIFIGSPVYAWTIPFQLYSFLKQTDFKGKRVVPFATSGGNEGAFFKDFEKFANNAVLANAKGFVKIDKNDIDEKIKNWVENIK
ncbi:MAG: hypothetical protein LBQ37_04465 [Elusimicrobiota bacterium]|jgi:flavodoxin|nr:hypothetical protein [Elusimicrobiota bacterium]